MLVVSIAGTRHLPQPQGSGSFYECAQDPGNPGDCSTKSRQGKGANRFVEYECEEVGFFPHPRECGLFYHCAPDSESGGLIPGLDACSADLVFCSHLSVCISFGDSSTPCPDGTAVKNSGGDEL